MSIDAINDAFLSGFMLGRASFTMPSEIYYPDLGFFSIMPFSLETCDLTKSWDGEIEYSLDRLHWFECDVKRIIASNTPSQERNYFFSYTFHIYLRGKNNTTIVGDNYNYFIFNLLASNDQFDYYLELAENRADWGIDIWPPNFYGWEAKNRELDLANIYSHIMVKGLLNTLLDYRLFTLTADEFFRDYPYDMDKRDIELGKIPEIQPYCFAGLFWDQPIVNTPLITTQLTGISEGCFSEMFSDCEYLVTAVVFIDGTDDFCCQCMFENCENLKYGYIYIDNEYSAQYCFEYMFSNCYDLQIETLDLPATTLESGCYEGMFYNCYNLTQIPDELSATILPYHCYYEMFYNCESITDIPNILATTLSGAETCYQMFEGCTSIEEIEIQLQPTTLSNYCYYGMFINCTSLETVNPYLLPATNLATQCYSAMFFGCSSLTSAPQLPATTLAETCYSEMFEGCTSLTTPPALNSTTLTSWCYEQMFRNCTSLETTGILPATSLPNGCYYQMFYGCTSLSSITIINATNFHSMCCQEMFKNSGIIVKSSIEQNYNTEFIIPYDDDYASIIYSTNQATTWTNNTQYQIGDMVYNTSFPNTLYRLKQDPLIEVTLTDSNNKTLVYTYYIRPGYAYSSISSINMEDGYSGTGTNLIIGSSLNNTVNWQNYWESLGSYTVNPFADMFYMTGQQNVTIQPDITYYLPDTITLISTAQQGRNLER